MLAMIGEIHNITLYLGLYRRNNPALDVAVIQMLRNVGVRYDRQCLSEESEQALIPLTPLQRSTCRTKAVKNTAFAAR